MNAVRVYADTSIFGGVFDSEFEELSRTFFEQVRSDAVDLVVSSVVIDELRDAPNHVRDSWRKLFVLSMRFSS